jgi:hypothetical protein
LRRGLGLGPMLRFLKYFRRNIWRTIWRFLKQITFIKAAKKDHNSVFQEKRQFSPTNCAKIAKIMDNSICLWKFRQLLVDKETAYCTYVNAKEAFSIKVA